MVGVHWAYNSVFFLTVFYLLCSFGNLHGRKDSYSVPQFTNRHQILILSIIFCSSHYFLGYYNFRNIQNNVINLVSLESQGRVEYDNRKYYGKKKLKLKKMNMTMFYFSCKTASCRTWSLSVDSFKMLQG